MPKENHPKEIQDLMGMSDPHFFSFSVLNDKIHTMVGHGIIFISREMHANQTVDLGGMMDDPRFEDLVKFIKSNYLKHNEPKPDIKP